MQIEFSQPESYITRASVIVTAEQAQHAYDVIADELSHFSWNGFQAMGDVNPGVWAAVDFGRDGAAAVDLETSTISVDRYNIEDPQLDVDPTTETEWVSYAPLLRKLLVA